MRDSPAAAAAVGLEMDSPEACQGQEESVCNDFCQGVGNRFCPFGFDRHAGGEGADFERVGAGEFVGCCGGHWLKYEIF